MKQIEHDKAIIVDWPPLNETQKRLRAVLTYWGGRNWCGGKNWLGRPDGTGGCAAVAYMKANGGAVFAQYPKDQDALMAAAKELGFALLTHCSDSGFENARKMVLRAIELAA